MIRVVSESELTQEGLRLGMDLPPRAIVALQGELGSGKTTFARGLVQGLGAGQTATSPTYALVHRHSGRRGPVFHVDCYRLRRPDEAEALDWETLLEEADALIVEWPERAGSWMPPATHRFRFHYLADESQRGLEELG